MNEKKKNIVDGTKDTVNMAFIPNKSVGIFVLGENINQYIFLPHEITYHEEKETPPYDDYYFYELYTDIWVENGKIDTIKCDYNCYWQGVNLIKMPFEQFLADYGVVPDKSEMIYTLVNEKRGQNQMVYTFDNLGLMIWVWRKKIVTVLVFHSQHNDNE
jgi:hypothetical protein